MASIRFDIDRFDGSTDFNLWQVRLEWVELDGKALSAIQLCLTNSVL
ncbi:hypothetical protein Godav_011454 [Gossypium davidsonii]|uniref:Uncharacterized protein n=2 Tax=Gossypium TaxID=3633 RepID=A0A7J8R9Z3_GOSDV|nr:hypothetical protein [Gossypium davidsonii]MBA0673581.1 hypothetical protein [Gossypium klotzschianum]